LSTGGLALVLILSERQRPLLRGRRPVRADRRLRANDEAVRTQSAILNKPQTDFAFIRNPAFSIRMRFLSVSKKQGWRAQRAEFC